MVISSVDMMAILVYGGWRRLSLLLSCLSVPIVGWRSVSVLIGKAILDLVGR